MNFAPPKKFKNHLNGKEGKSFVGSGARPQQTVASDSFGKPLQVRFQPATGIKYGFLENLDVQKS